MLKKRNQGKQRLIMQTAKLFQHFAPSIALHVLHLHVHVVSLMNIRLGCGYLCMSAEIEVKNIS